MADAVCAGRGKKRQVPVGADTLYRDLMKLYAALLRQGVAPRLIDETDLEDFFVMLDAEDAAPVRDDDWY